MRQQSLINIVGWNKPSSMRSWNRIFREYQPEEFATSWRNLVSTVYQQKTVSHLGKSLDDKVNEFLSRPIEQPILYLIVDAVYVKVRRQSRYVNTAVLIIAGIREDGYREILGFCSAESENEGFWLSLFDDLKSRGLRGVHLVISDGHEGIQNAVKTSFLGASWQMCQVVPFPSRDPPECPEKAAV